MSEEKRRLPVIQSEKDSTQRPIFDKVGVIGLGLIGGSLALAVRQTWPTSLVIGVDDKEVLEKAMILHAIDVASHDPVVLAEADLVVLAAPARENIRLLKELPNHVKGSAIVTDVSSTKRMIVDAANTLPSRLIFVGGHPLGGAPRAGIEFARADLFKGRPWLFTPTDRISAAVLDRLFEFVKALGANSHVIEATEHDRLLAFISHLPQLTASTLMHVVGSAAGVNGLALAGRGLSDATRLASSPVDIWNDICATNSDFVNCALNDLICELQILRDDLSSDKAISRIFSSAGTWRSKLSQMRQDSVKG